MARILIAEDEPDIRELVAFTLRFAGHEVTATSNGEEALQQASQIVPDIIIMDVRMPKMTGYDACRAMKADAKLKDIPVVFLSAKGQDAEIQTGLDAGAEEYLLKPFAPNQLSERVKTILAKFGK
ncbi:MAG: response regulator [Chloroflexi bacterium]|jgi:DNA-binding response OmpR family regulator|nr:response regulator [Chloroflexota bacterium]